MLSIIIFFVIGYYFLFKERHKYKKQFDWIKKNQNFISIVVIVFGLIYFLNEIFSPRPQIIVPNRSVPYSNPVPNVCQSCKILGDCSAFPQCERRTTCRQRWNDITGSWEINCSQF